MSFGAAQPTGRAEGFAHLFRAQPLKADGQLVFKLRPCGNDGILRLSHLDWGNGDGVYFGNDGRLYLGAIRANGRRAWGWDRDNDGLWAVETKDRGFAFRNVATGRYLGTSASHSSETPVVWYYLRH